MKIGLISDSHNHLSNLISTLENFRSWGIKTVIHCGDLTDFSFISYFSGFRVIYTFGNSDVATGVIRTRLAKANPESFAGLVFRGKLNGIPVAATHSHIEGEVMNLVQEKRYRWIFHGHSHQRRDDVVQGARIVNPGALGSAGRSPNSFAVVDLAAGDVAFHRAA